MRDSRSSASRRRVLRAAGGALALPALGGLQATRTRAHPGPKSDSGTGTETETDAGSRTRAHPDDYEPLGRVEVTGTKEAVVEGGVAYLATTTGFATVDLSDPAAPSVLADRRDPLAEREDGPLHGIWDVKVDGDALLVVGPAHGGTDGLAAAALYDVSDPANPRRRTVYGTDYPIHNAFLDGETAYLTGNDGHGNPLVVVDAAAGEELGRWSLADVDDAWLDVPPSLRTLHDVWVQDGVASLAYWDAGTWQVDVGDPTAPELLARIRGPAPSELAEREQADVIEPPGNDHYVTVNEDGTLLGIGVESWDARPDDGRGGPGGIHLYDVSTPAEPREVATITPPRADDETREGTWTTSHNFELANDRLYSSWYQGGIRVFDLSEPSAPGLLRAWEDRDAASFWTAQSAAPGDFFVASSTDYRGELPALFTFPDAPLDERSTLTQTPTPTATPGAGNSTGGGSSGGSAGGSVETETPTPTSTPTPTETPTTDGDGPGFGPLAALAAIGAGAWAALRAGGDGNGD